MKAFQMKDDENRIYFRNYERKLAEEELTTLVKELEAEGCQVSIKKAMGLEDIYEGSKEGMRFRIIFTGEESFIYSESKETIENILKIFE